VSACLEQCFSPESRKDSSASSDPSVLACTHTPSPDLSTLLKMSCKEAQPIQHTRQHTLQHQYWHRHTCVKTPTHCWDNSCTQN
jgi:hypothetical protein